jgi:hypothetical protein
MQLRRTWGLPVSNGLNIHPVAQEAYFRKVLPVAQTVVAAIFGGWGFWVRNQAITNGLGWRSTMVFHVWPWPLRFASILNMPALLFGFVLSLPVYALLPRVPEWVSSLLLILFVPLIWFWVGRWLDKLSDSHSNAKQRKAAWIAVGIFTAICAGLAALGSSSSSFTGFGLLIWLAAGIAVFRVTRFRKSKRGPSSRGRFIRAVSG